MDLVTILGWGGGLYIVQCNGKIIMNAEHVRILKL